MQNDVKWYTYARARPEKSFAHVYSRLNLLQVLRNKEARELRGGERKRKKGNKKKRRWGREGAWGEASGQEIRYEEVGGIWVSDGNILSCFCFSSPVLSSCLSSSTPPLCRVLRAVWPARQHSRWPTPESRSLEEQAAVPCTTSRSMGLFWQGRQQ